jgi:hypothetical protein
MTTVGRRCRRFPALAASSSLILPLMLSSASAAESCVQLSIFGYDDFLQSRTDARQTPTFRTNDRFVLCLRLGTGTYLSLWDAPPHGAIDRLYPNKFSPDPNARAIWLDAGLHCFGTPETFPLVHPRDEGTGPGRISAVATASLEAQPTADDYRIPGRSERNERQFSLGAAATPSCGPVMKAIIDYRVEAER